MDDVPLLRFTDVVPSSTVDGALILVSSRGLYCSWCAEPITAFGLAPYAHQTLMGQDGRSQIGCWQDYRAIAGIDIATAQLKALSAFDMGRRYPIVDIHPDLRLRVATVIHSGAFPLNKEADDDAAHP